MWREALCALLASRSEFRVVGDAGTGRDAVALAKKLVPDVLLLDNRLPDMSPLEIAHRLRTAGAPPRMLALCGHGDSRFGRQMHRSGLSGYVIETASARELIRAIHKAAHGARDSLPDLGAPVTADASVTSDHPPSLACLAAREREVLKLVAEGAHSPVIAMRLGIAVGTVDVHRRNLMRKLNIHSIATLTRYAIREGLTSP